MVLEIQRDMCLIWDLNLSLPCLQGWHCFFFTHNMEYVMEN